MQQAEKIRVLIFLSLIAIVYVMAAGTLVRYFLHSIGYLPLKYNKPRIWINRIILGLAFTGLLCFLYGYFIEPYWPQITQVQIKSVKILEDSQSIRIVHISDLHSDPRPRLEERLPTIIANEKPDIIVFTGDSINSPDGLPVFKRCLSQLSSIAPTFVVKGNWDAGFWHREDLFGGTGVQELRGKAVELNIRGLPVWINGLPASSTEKELKESLELIPQNMFTIFLHHYPDEIYEVARHKVDLYCAGHIHGGQVALPFYGALMTLSKYGKRFEAGLYQIDGTQLYVNRGIGMEGGHAPRVRFWARPEITVIRVVK
jgi:uncharacterized protein